MGQAKRRGTFEERKAQAFQAVQREEERKQKILEEWNALSEEEKEKRIRALKEYKATMRKARR